jgi:Domain of unknown function (DUF1918)
MHLDMLGTIVVAVAASGPAPKALRASWRARATASHQHDSGKLKGVKIMQAQVGDRLVVASRHLDEHLRSGEIVEVHGANGSPPYVVKWADEQRTALIFPGPDAHVEPAAAGGRAR